VGERADESHANHGERLALLDCGAADALGGDNAELQERRALERHALRHPVRPLDRDRGHRPVRDVEQRDAVIDRKAGHLRADVDHHTGRRISGLVRKLDARIRQPEETRPLRPAAHDAGDDLDRDLARAAPGDVKGLQRALPEIRPENSVTAQDIRNDGGDRTGPAAIGRGYPVPPPHRYPQGLSAHLFLCES
jgi:hypothetical protein